MATFMQWNKSRPVRKVGWVCGPERVLMREVVSEYKHLDATGYPYYPAPFEEPQLWDSLLSWPRGASLAIVYEAEKLRMLDRFEVLIATIPDLAHVLFVSADGDFARVEDEEGKRRLAPHLAAIQASKDGQLIRCCRPSREEDLLRLVASWWPGAGSNLAAEIMTRTGGDLESAYLACKTAEAARTPARSGYLDLVCQQAPLVRYVDQLLAGNRKAAASEAISLAEPGVGGALKHLSGQMSALAAYHKYSAQGLDPDQIARRGIPRWQQNSLAPIAGAYGTERVIRCRTLLAMAEDAFRSGVRTGVLEAVAALW